MGSSRLVSFQVTLAILFSIEAAWCAVTINPGNNVLLYTGDSTYFGCNATTDRNDSFVSSVHIYKVQDPVATFNGTQANLTGLPRNLFASSSIRNFFEVPFAGGKWTASYNQSSAYSVSLYVNTSGLQPQDTGIYYCEFHVAGATAAVHQVSAATVISVVERTPNLTINLTFDAPLLNSTSTGELVINDTGLYNITMACSASALPLAPDVQLWVSGNNVLQSATRYTNSTLIGNAVGFQLPQTLVVVSYTVSLNNIKGCTSVRCSGYIPQYKGLAELASKQVIIKRSSDYCPAQGSGKLAISSNHGAQLDGAGISALVVVATFLISHLIH